MWILQTDRQTDGQTFSRHEPHRKNRAPEMWLIIIIITTTTTTTTITIRC